MVHPVLTVYKLSSNVLEICECDGHPQILVFGGRFTSFRLEFLSITAFRKATHFSFSLYALTSNHFWIHMLNVFVCCFDMCLEWSCSSTFVTNVNK